MTSAGSLDAPPDMVGPPAGGGLRRALVLMSATSIIVPAAGLLVQPVLARALGADGRGVMAAAIAPASLVGSVATLGLPDALMYLLAKDSRQTRRALSWAIGLSVGLGIVCVLVTFALAPALAAGDHDLARLITLAVSLTIPTLVVGTFRGAAMGQQKWRRIAVESVINSALRVVAFTGLWVVGSLTPLTAVLIQCLTPIVAGLVYLPLLRRPPAARGPAVTDRLLPSLLTFGSRVWLGSVASMLLAKTDTVLMVPLSSARDLGLYSVANTITDVPLLVTGAICGALGGVNSQENDPQKVADTSRLTVLLGLVACAGLAACSPLLVEPVFGAQFAAAVIPTVMLSAGAFLVMPGLVAGAGLASSGHPGLRSAGLVATLVVNVLGFVVLVPRYGVIGACWVSLISGVVLSSVNLANASRVMHLPVRRFLLPDRADVARLQHEGAGLVARVRPARRRSPGRHADR